MQRESNTWIGDVIWVDIQEKVVRLEFQKSWTMKHCYISSTYKLWNSFLYKLNK